MKIQIVKKKDDGDEVGNIEEMTRYKTNRHERRAMVAYERGRNERERKQAIKDNLTEGKLRHKKII